MNSPRQNEAPKTTSRPASQGVSLSVVLVLTFVVQIFAAVSITGYLSFRNGQKAVKTLAARLQREVSDRVTLHLDYYLATPSHVNEINLSAYQLGILNLQKQSSLQHYFYQQMQIFDQLSYINFGSERGEFIGIGRQDNGTLYLEVITLAQPERYYRYSLDQAGNKHQMIATEKYNFREDEWYSKAVIAGKPTWSNIYQWQDIPEIISISLSYPVYNPQAQLVGVIGVDFILSQISNFLCNLKVSSSGKVFILERNGMLVASSSKEQLMTTTDGKITRLHSSKSSDELVKASSDYIQQTFGDLKAITTNQTLKFKLAGKSQFVQITPWQDELGLDWLIVVVIPEADFMGEINTINRTTILLCLVSLIVASGLGIFTSAWLARPICRLSSDCCAIAQGNLDRLVEVKGIKELQILSRSFNQMIEQLKTSLVILEQKNQALESQTLQLQKTKEAAEIGNRTKNEFIANMSHELRTPLNTVLGFTRLMNRDSNLTSQQQANLQIINRSGEHLLSLIDNILNLAKIESGHMTLNPTSFDLHCLLNSVADMFKLKAKSKGIELVCQYPPTLPRFVKTDEQKLRQVLVNLLSNALKFTHRGKVSLRISAVEHLEKSLKIHCEVADTGDGIAADELKSLFEPFVQTASGKKLQEGTGLGLPLSQKFIQLMKGEITINSSLGQGTTAQFYFLVEPSSLAAVHQTPQRKVIGLKPGQPNYRILVVDDRWENRQMLVQLLESIGFDVLEAENGQEAILIWSSCNLI